MARKHHAKRRPADVSVSAAADIAFLLIIYFILATTLVQISGVVTEIPSGEKAETTNEEETATVQLKGDQIFFDEQRIEMKGLRKKLAQLNLHLKAGDDKVILLEAGRNVTYQNYFDVMASISDAGGVTAILQEEE
jgi:biopolymer transport protein ExbD